MHSRAVRIKKLGLVTIRPLRNGDTMTVAALFDRLGSQSRIQRFNGAKPRLSDSELTQLATVDARRHALVAYVAEDREPAGLAQLVRDPERWEYGEIAFAVADCYQNQRIGSTLVELLAADARASGITHLVATMQSSNDAAFRLIRRVAKLVNVRHEGGEASVVAAFDAAVSV